MILPIAAYMGIGWQWSCLNHTAGHGVQYLMFLLIIWSHTIRGCVVCLSFKWIVSRDGQVQKVKGTVQREPRGVKIGTNRTARINCIAGKCHLPCPKGHHHERSFNVIAAVVLFDAIPTGWVSKHNSVGLIPLQRRCSDAVAAQRRSIPKCSFPFGIVVVV